MSMQDSYKRRVDARRMLHAIGNLQMANAVRPVIESSKRH